MIDINTEKRLKEIAKSRNRDIKELVEESSTIITKLFKWGHCTANGLKKSWSSFTNGLASTATALADLNVLTPTILPTHQPLVTVKKSDCAEFPAGAQMSLFEAEQIVKRQIQKQGDSSSMAGVTVIIDYRMDNEQDRYCMSFHIGRKMGGIIDQMQEHMERASINPSIVYDEFYNATFGLDDLLHTYFGPIFHEETEKLRNRVVGYFRQHCTISQLEQQFEKQAQTMPLRVQHHFRKSTKKAISAMRQATNTGQDISLPQCEAPKQSNPEIQATSQKEEAGERPRQSVKVQLRQLKEGQSGKSTIRKSRSGPQR